MDICFIDDRRENREGWLQGFGVDIVEQANLRVFASAAEWCAWLDEGNEPDLVFVDFFVDGAYGTELIEDLRSRFASGVFIVAHSSMSEANAGMVQAGANAMLPKVRLEVPSSTIRDTFPSMAHLHSFLERS